MRSELTAGGGLILGLIFGIAVGNPPLGMTFGLLLGAAAAAKRSRAPRSSSPTNSQSQPGPDRKQ
jgi:hypothetical protein